MVCLSPMKKDYKEIKDIPVRTKVQDILDKHGISIYMVAASTGKSASDYTGTWAKKIRGERKLTRKELLGLVSYINEVTGLNFSASDLGFEICSVRMT